MPGNRSLEIMDSEQVHELCPLRAIEGSDTDTPGHSWSRRHSDDLLSAGLAGHSRSLPSWDYSAPTRASRARGL
jgi:hypothetical protein